MWGAWAWFCHLWNGNDMNIYLIGLFQELDEMWKWKKNLTLLSKFSYWWLAYFLGNEEALYCSWKKYEPEEREDSYLGKEEEGKKKQKENKHWA